MPTSAPLIVGGVRVEGGEMMRVVGRTFWQEHDDRPGEDYIIPEVHIEEAQQSSASGWLVAKNRGNGRYFRVAYQYDSSAPGTPDVSYAERSDWEAVEEQWVPVEGEAEQMEEEAAERKQGGGDREETTSSLRGVFGESRAIVDSEMRMSADEERTTIQFMTEDVARDGMVLEADGLDTSAYEENPVVLWQHGRDPRRRAEPIAKTVDIQRNSDGYLATIEWHPDDFSQRIKRKVKEGFLNAASVGWNTEDMARHESPPRITESDMTEFSIVSVPADAGALVEQRAGDQGPVQSLLQRLESLEEKINDLRAEATATSPSDDSAVGATGAEASPEDRDAAQGDGSPDDAPETGDSEQYIRLSTLKKLMAERGRQWTREDIRTELKKQLGMA